MDLTERPEAAGVRHPWEQARLRHVLSLLDQHGALRSGGLSLLDAGSGDAFIAEAIAAQVPGARVTCWDAHYTDEDLAASTPGTRRTRTRPDERYDVVLALDVIEHVPDDKAFLRDLRRCADDGALLLVTVPAYQALFSDHDIRLGHHRRYSRRSLTAAVDGTGWRCDALGGFFASLLPVRTLAVLAERLRQTRGAAASERPPNLGTWDRGPLVTAAITRALSADAGVGRRAAAFRRGLPGLSIFMVARAVEGAQ